MDGAFEFRSPRLIRFGRGVFGQAGSDVAALGVTRALIVCGPSRVGQADRLLALCDAAGVEATIYRGVDSEPVVQHVEDGLREYREFGANGVIGLGGGSAMDTAKAVAAMATNPGRIADYMVPNRLTTTRAPLLCIPTTAGTGSEVTRATIITDPKTQVKMLISDPLLVPDAAIDDPALTDTCPPNVTASSGIDALTHAIEASVSRRGNPLSAMLALSAIRRISGSLRRAYDDGTDTVARDVMLLGQLEAGLAFSNSSVALVHGMARPLGAYFHVPHGVANGILLPVVMDWSQPAAPAAYAGVARALSPTATNLTDDAAARVGVMEVLSLCRHLKLPNLADMAGGADAVRSVAAQMARHALASGSPANNPRLPSEEEIVGLYEQALAAR